MEDVSKLVARLYDHISRRLAKLEAKIDYLDEKISDLESRVEEVRRTVEEVKRLAETVREDLGLEARNAVARVLERLGVKTAIQPAVIEGYSFDIYAQLKSYTIVGRAYVVAGKSEVERLKRDVDSARRLRPELFPGNIVLVVYALRYEGPSDDILVVTPSSTIIPRSLNP